MGLTSTRQTPLRSPPSSQDKTRAEAVGPWRPQFSWGCTSQDQETELLLRSEKPMGGGRSKVLSACYGPLKVEHKQGTASLPSHVRLSVFPHRRAEMNPPNSQAKAARSLLPFH